MNKLILAFALLLLGVLMVGAFRTVLDRKFPFVRKFSEETRAAFAVLTVAAILLLASYFFDFRRIQSFEIAGVKATLIGVEQKVQSLSDQIEALFQRKRIEIFEANNWSQVRTVEKQRDHFLLEVTLKEEPIIGSVEVFEGPLPMPEQDYLVSGKRLQFPANSNRPTSGITIKYYPRQTGGMSGK